MAPRRFGNVVSNVGRLMASDGHIELPTKPGLGFDLIESEVEKTKEFRLVLAT